MDNPIFPPPPSTSGKNFFFVLDLSGSMGETITYNSVTKSKWAFIEEYMDDFIDALDATNKVNVVAFNDRTP